MDTRITELTQDNTRLRADNAEQRALTTYYAHIINELSTELEHATATRDQVLANIRPIAAAPSLRLRQPEEAEAGAYSRIRPSG
jgi:hypothetical protein